MKKPHKIHWERYICRKIIILSIMGIGFFLIEAHTGNHYFGKFGEFTFASIVEHVFFGIPTVEV